MNRGSSLSDTRIVKKINKQFIAVEINITDKGFPKDVRALKLWEAAYKKNWKSKFGFATSVVINPTGKYAVGTSGCGHTWEWDTSINYDAKKYNTYLNESLDRFARAKALEDADPRDPETARDLRKLRAEVIKSLQEANRCKKAPKD